MYCILKSEESREDEDESQSSEDNSEKDSDDEYRPPTKMIKPNDDMNFRRAGNNAAGINVMEMDSREDKEEVRAFVLT